jgi:hypothetical protein
VWLAPPAPGQSPLDCENQKGYAPMGMASSHRGDSYLAPAVKPTGHKKHQNARRRSGQDIHKELRHRHPPFRQEVEDCPYIQYAITSFYSRLFRHSGLGSFASQNRASRVGLLADTCRPESIFSSPLLLFQGKCVTVKSRPGARLTPSVPGQSLLDRRLSQ